MNKKEIAQILSILFSGFVFLVVLTMIITFIGRHNQSVDNLQNAINNKPDLASINQQVLDNENRSFNSTILLLLPITVFSPMPLIISISQYGIEKWRKYISKVEVNT